MRQVVSLCKAILTPELKKLTPAELVLDGGGGMQRPPCLTYSEDAIADSAARRNPVRVDVAVPGNLEERSPVLADCKGKQAIPLAALRVGDEGEHGLFEA